MYLYIDFYIYNKENDRKFLFWSCALDTICTNVDYKYLNNENKYSLQDFPNLSIVEDFKEFSFTDIDSDNSYQKRLPVFLPKDEIFETGSPYKNCCSELINYYKNPEIFVSAIKEYFASYKDYEIHEIQNSAINKIKELVGFDLTKAQSYPGCISIFQPLSQFCISIDVRKKIITIDSKSGINSFIAEIEGLSVESSAKSKIVFKQLYSFENKNKVEIYLPENVEILYTVHITIFQNEQNSIKCIYEEFFHMVKNVFLNMDLKSGNSTIIKNRFLNNKIEKKEVSERQSNFSSRDNSDFTDWDRRYHQYLFGKEKKYLESNYFFKETTEKKKFLKWIRSKLSDAKKVFIIDPFLSFNGFYDFISCYNSYFSLTIVTTDPIKLHRNDENNESEKLAEKIYDEFPSAKVYYLDKDELHDRYMIVETADETRYYSFSNSWQGLLKDYSLLIQEMDYESSLKLKSDYEDIIMNNQPVAKIEVLSESDDADSRNKDTKTDIEQLRKAIKALNGTQSADCIIGLFCNLFNTAKHWWEVTDDFENIYYLLEGKKKEIVPKIINKLLTKERQEFESDGHFAIGQKFSSYTKVKEIMARVRERGFCGYAEYELKLDYAYYHLLECFFVHDDLLVITELEKQENEIFVFEIGDKYPHFVSELIISSMLCNRFVGIRDRDLKIALEMAKRTQYSYCRLYIAEGLYNKNYNKDFSEMIKYVEQIPLTDEELICFLYSMYTSKIFANCQTDAEKYYPEKIECYVHDIFFNKSIEFILQFSVEAYLIGPRKLNLQGLERFLNLFEEKSKISEKIYKFFLLYAVRKSQNNKLYDFLKKEFNIDKQYFDYIEEVRDIRLLNETGEFAHKKSVVDVSEFRSHIPLLANSLANLIEKKENVSDLCKKLIYKMAIHKNLIMGTHTYYDCGLDYFSLLIILYTLYLLGDKCEDVNKIVKSISWYIPILLNVDPDDFYGFSYNCVGLYFQFIDESKRLDLCEKISDSKIKILCKSMLKYQPNIYLKDYEAFFTDFEIDNDYDKSKNIFYALNVFINLCLIDHNVIDADKGLFFSIAKKISAKIPKANNSIFESILNNGINYIEKPSNEAKTTLLKSIKDVFFPYSILGSVRGN